MVCSDMKSDQKTKGNNGCLKGCGCLTLGFILFALAAPRSRYVKDTCSNCAVRNGLVIGIKESLLEKQIINPLILLMRNLFQKLPIQNI